MDVQEVYSRITSTDVIQFLDKVAFRVYSKDYIRSRMDLEDIRQELLYAVLDKGCRVKHDTNFTSYAKTTICCAAATITNPQRNRQLRGETYDPQSVGESPEFMQDYGEHEAVERSVTLDMIENGLRSQSEAAGSVFARVRSGYSRREAGRASGVSQRRVTAIMNRARTLATSVKGAV